MRLIRGIVNALLMVTLVRPIVRLTVSRWRKQAREAAPALISVPVQELFEAALIEELSPPAVEIELEQAAEAEPLEELETLAQAVVVEAAGRSALRTLLLAGALLTVIAIAGVVIARVVQRRRAAEAEWVAVPVEAEEVAEAEAIATGAE